jgi:hypothetical protein
MKIMKSIRFCIRALLSIFVIIISFLVVLPFIGGLYHCHNKRLFNTDHWKRKKRVHNKQAEEGIIPDSDMLTEVAYQEPEETEFEPVNSKVSLKKSEGEYSYTATQCIKKTNELLEENGIELKINMYSFLLFCRVYGIKKNDQLTLVENANTKNPHYLYSYETVVFIVNEIKKDPEHVIESMKNK